jgi:AcrR family transcriptional regulator
MMVQVKKADVREAILEGAFDLFLTHGYTHTTLSEISRKSGVTVSNIYNYFDSKLSILAAIYGPWFDDQLSQLSRRVDTEPTPRRKIKLLILGLVQEIPEKDGGFAHLWLEAIASRQPEDTYSRDMLFEFEERVSDVIRRSLPPQLRQQYTEQNLLSHLLFMAFDGFAINYHASGSSKRASGIAELMTNAIFASPDHQSR